MKPTRLLILLACVGTLAAAEAVPANVNRQGTVILSLSGTFPLRPHFFLLGEQNTSLHDATMRLREAVNAPEGRLVLNLSDGFDPDLAAAEEFASVLRSRPAGKQVACLLDTSKNSVLAVAAACDEVVMVEAGMLLVSGLAMSNDYYADALAKLGVHCEAVISGPAKTAPEPLTRNRPSEAAIQEHQRLLQSLDRALIEASRRGALDEAALRAIRASAPQTGAIAVAGKLVDRAVEPGTWLKEQPAPVRYFKEDSNLPDLSTIGGMMAFWSTLMQGESQPRQPKVVAVVELEGLITDEGDSNPGFTIVGPDTADLFDRLAADARVMAVVVRVNSGGGSATASDRIHHAIRRVAQAKPVVALFDAVAASGGYYLGCAADEVLVHHGTITGSIGVFALHPSLDGTRDLLGIHRHTLLAGPRADLFSTAGLTPDKEAALRQVVEDIDQRFQGLVAQRRKLAPERVRELAGGKVFTGDEAVALGLADKIGTLASAVIRARELAKIPTPLPLERYPRHGGLAARLGLTGASVTVAGVEVPAEFSVWLRLIGAGRPLIMAWTEVGTVR
jgi:protease-4